MDILDVFDGAPEHLEHGGEREQWSIRCQYEHQFPVDEQRLVLESILTIAGFVQTTQEYGHLLLFREVGHMDEAISGATITLSGIQRLYVNPINHVSMVSLYDVGRRTTDDKFPIYDIAQTVQAGLRAIS